MQKAIKILICLFLFFSCPMFFPFCSAKYVIEDLYKIATLNIDCSKPKFDFVDVDISNVDSSGPDNKNNLITIHFKVTEKHIVKNNISQDNIKIYVDNKIITPEYRDLFVAYKGTNELIYEFSFVHVASDNSLIIEIPEGVIVDSSSLTNDKSTFFINNNS